MRSITQNESVAVCGGLASAPGTYYTIYYDGDGNGNQCSESAFAHAAGGGALKGAAKGAAMGGIADPLGGEIPGAVMGAIKGMASGAGLQGIKCFVQKTNHRVHYDPGKYPASAQSKHAF